MQKHMLVFCAVLGVAFAWVALHHLEPKPEKYKDVEGCYVEELDVVIPWGESRPSTKMCMEFNCTTEWLKHVGCLYATIVPPCEVVEEKDKPYPECCPKIKCEDGD